MTRRLVVSAALAAFAACAVAAIPAAGATPPGNCVSWLGARDTGQCIGESTGGLPQVGFNGRGIETGPLLPGRSINVPLG